MENVTGPFIHTKNTKEKIKKSILISLLPLILFAFYKNGIVLFFSGKVGFIDSIYPLLLIFICMISMFIFDILYTMILRKDNVNIKSFNCNQPIENKETLQQLFDIANSVSTINEKDNFDAVFVSQE